MKHVPTDKYSVAWFKLADCISRGEKERALGVYRLLSHSLDDSALACQLEADILWSFNDPLAIEKYQEAALNYQTSNRLLEAAAVYEHLVTLEPYSIYYLTSLVELFKKLNLPVKVAAHATKLFDLALANRNTQLAIDLLKDTQNILQPKQQATMHQQLVLTLLQQESVPHTIVDEHMKKAVDSFIDSNSNKALQQFLSQLQALDQDCYVRACSYMKDDTLKK